MFSANFNKICCILAKNKIFEKSQDGGHIVKRLLP